MRLPFRTIPALSSLVAVAASAQNVPVPSDKLPLIKALYKDAATLYAKCNTEFAKNEGSEVGALDISRSYPAVSPPFYLVRGALSLRVWEDSMTLASVDDFALSQKLRDEIYRNKAPTLSAAQALDRATGYLKQWNMPPSANVAVTQISYDLDVPACWYVRWSRFAGAYCWDDSNSLYNENVFVMFHEDFGLVSLGTQIYTPPPLRLVVKITREDAIKRAAVCVPLIQETPFYKHGRMDGFSVRSLASCELRVSVPNWLLDPKRAVWMSDKPPKETLLCWVVMFKSVDSKADQRPISPKSGKHFKLDCPDFWIYIDAATGEVVGANFT